MKQLVILIALGVAIMCAVAAILGALATAITPPAAAATLGPLVCSLPGQPTCIVGRPLADRSYAAPDGRTFDQLVAAHVLPDPAQTPGVINSAIQTPDQIKATICTLNWTTTVRPPTSFTDKLRAQMTPAGHKPGDGELDHLSSIEDTGFPGLASQPALSAQNLWWMIYADRYGARVKDVLETKLHRMICAGQITPAGALAALSPNWLVGYVHYIGPLPK